MKKEQRKIPTRTLCMLGMLLAITTILAIYGTFRVGNMIKIPTKFIGVYIAGALFGPVWSGVVAALGDVLNCAIAPVGPWIPLLTLVELLSGVLYGVLFIGWKEGKKNYFVRVAVCLLLQALIDVFLTTPILVHVGYFPNFQAAVGIRLPATALKAIMQGVVLGAGYVYLPLFRRLAGRETKGKKNLLKSENNG